MKEAEPSASSSRWGYMSKKWNQTRVATALGIEYPIIQGPLGGFSSQRLTAAVSNFGGLGSFGGHSLEPQAITDRIAEIRSLTSKPFAMNLWVSMEDQGAAGSDAAAFRRALSHLAPHIEAVGGTQPHFAPYSPIRFEDQARSLFDAKVPVFSFIYGIPPQEIQSRTDLADPWFHGQARSRHPQRTSGIFESARYRGPSLSAPASPHAQSCFAGSKGGKRRTACVVGRTERESRPLPKRGRVTGFACGRYGGEDQSLKLDQFQARFRIDELLQMNRALSFAWATDAALTAHPLASRFRLTRVLCTRGKAR